MTYPCIGCDVAVPISSEVVDNGMDVMCVECETALINMMERIGHGKRS